MDSSISHDPWAPDDVTAPDFRDDRWRRAGATPDEVASLGDAFSALRLSDQVGEVSAIDSVSDGELAEALERMRSADDLAGFRAAPAPAVEEAESAAGEGAPEGEGEGPGEGSEASGDAGATSAPGEPSADPEGTSEPPALGVTSLAVDPVAKLDPATGGKLLLDNLVAVLETMGVDLPDLVGVVPGALVAYDGPQFTVNFLGITRGIPGGPENQPTNPFVLRQFFSYEVNLLRAIAGPTGTPSRAAVAPSLAAQALDYAIVADDAAALWAAIVAIQASYAIVPPNIPFMYGPMVTLGPDGGLAGSRLPVYWSAT